MHFFAVKNAIMLSLHLSLYFATNAALSLQVFDSPCRYSNKYSPIPYGGRGIKPPADIQIFARVAQLTERPADNRKTQV